MCSDTKSLSQYKDDTVELTDQWKYLLCLSLAHSYYKQQEKPLVFPSRCPSFSMWGRGDEKACKQERGDAKTPRPQGGSCNKSLGWAG